MLLTLRWEGRSWGRGPGGMGSWRGPLLRDGHGGRLICLWQAKHRQVGLGKVKVAWRPRHGGSRGVEKGGSGLDAHGRRHLLRWQSGREHLGRGRCAWVDVPLEGVSLWHGQVGLGVPSRRLVGQPSGGSPTQLGARREHHGRLPREGDPHVLHGRWGGVDIYKGGGA